jgi:glycosyltransferase involved in cell wall biosynthesis
LLWTQWQLPRIYRALKAQLLFSPVPEAPLFADNRTVVMVHDLIPLRFPSRGFSPLVPYFRYYIPHVVQQAEHAICNSEATARDVVDSFGVASDKITAIPLAADTERFRPLDLPTLDYFLYIGRPDPYKNLHRLIRAFAKIRGSCDCQLWLAGPMDPRYTPLLQTLAAELGVSHRVKFLDYVPDEQLPILLNQAIALVFPSLWEGFGLPVLEAMACGTPVITSNVSSLPEVAGEAAILVNPYSTDELAEAMQTLAEDGPLRSRLRQAGLQQANQFSWAKTGAATVEVLKRWL